MYDSRPMLISNRFRTGCGLLVLVLLLGTLGFTLIEGWEPISAFFTSMLVVSTLGFGDHKPTSAAGRVLTITLIGCGVGTLYYLVGALAQTVIEQQFDWSRRRTMAQRVARLCDHFIVCGFGRVGQQICRQLAQEQCLFVVVDSDDLRIGSLQETGYLYVHGDANDDSVLRRAGIERARGLLSALPSDAGNVYITLSARALNPKLFIVARAATGEAEHKLTIAGAKQNDA